MGGPSFAVCEGLMLHVYQKMFPGVVHKLAAHHGLEVFSVFCYRPAQRQQLGVAVGKDLYAVLPH